MYLLLLGLIAVGAGLLFVYYSMKDRKSKVTEEENWDPEDKGKVIFLFDEEDDKSGFSDPKSAKPKAEKKEKEVPEEPTEQDD